MHLNLTAPGNVVCSVYAPTIKPAFTERRVKHAGHARVFIAGLQEDSAYSVQCSLSVTVMCFPHRKHFGEMSMHSFRRFAKTVFVSARAWRDG